MRTKTKSTSKTSNPTNKSEPVTWPEVLDYTNKFESWIKTKGGKEAVQAFQNLQFLQIVADHGATALGQTYVKKARRSLNKFLGVKHV